MLGDDPNSTAHRQKVVGKLAWSAGLFAIATAIAICLQVLFASPSFCTVMSKMLHHDRSKRKSWSCSFGNMLRFLVAYCAAGGALLAILLHLIATILIIDVFKPYAPALVAQLVMGLIFFAGLFGWLLSVMLEW